MRKDIIELHDLAIINYGKGLPAINRKQGDIPVYGSSGITGYHNEKLIDGPILIIGRKGSIGNTYYETGSCYPIDTVFYIKETENINLKYLYYFLKTLNLKNLNTDAAVPGLNRDVLYSQKIIVFSKDIQNKIANILSKYDDLIENNLKRIELLEEAAQRLYKEWFIDLRFPGHEKVKIENAIPEGWEISNLYDICSVQMGYAFKGKYFNENKEGVPAIRIRDIPDQKTKTYTTEKADEEYLVKSGDILIGMDGIFHNDVWCGEEGYLVQRVCRLRSYQENIQGFIWQAIKEPISYYNNTIVGATVAHLGAKHLKEIFIKHPKIEKNNFFKPFNDLMKQKILLETQNQKLIEARDRLLPKLMKGEIEV